MEQNINLEKSIPMFCQFCGAKLRENAAFCSKCGKQVGEIITNQSVLPTEEEPNSINNDNMESLLLPDEEIVPLVEDAPVQENTSVAENVTGEESISSEEVVTLDIPPIQENVFSDWQLNQSDTVTYSFDPLYPAANGRMINDYWAQKRASVSVSTKWMDFYVRFIMLINLILAPISVFVELYEKITQYYNSDYTAYFSVPVNSVLFAFTIFNYLLIAYGRMYLKHWDPKGIMCLWLIATTFLLVVLTVIIDYSIYGVHNQILTNITPFAVQIFVLWIPTLIYFEKRRFMYYEHSVYNRKKLTISTKSKIGILALFSINALFLIIAFCLSNA